MDTEKVIMEFLPAEESERSVRLTALRTEIMSGKGPDVLLLSCRLPMGNERTEFAKSLKTGNPIKKATSSRELLFHNISQCMEDGLFLPLDDYLKNAKFFDATVIEPAILEAGKTKDGQMILPLTFTLPTAVYEENFADRKAAEQIAYGATAWNQFPDLFGEVADYQKRELLFSEQELLETVKSVLSACPAEIQTVGCADPITDMRLSFSPEETGGLVSLGSLNYLDLENWQPNYFSGRWEVGAAPEVIAPIKNREGGVTAEITAYACINRNTKHPKEAFQVLDLLVRRETMGEIIVRDNPKNKGDVKGYITTVYYDMFGIPLRNDLMKDAESGFGYCRPYIGRNAIDITTDEGSTAYDTYKDLRTQVTHARFYGELDWALQEMFNECREAKTEEEMEEIVSRAYNTMQMILAES